MEEADTGPKDPHSTVLSSSPSESIRCFPSTIAYYALQPTIPHLTRSSLPLSAKTWDQPAAGR
jgi:hypothetical protein